MHAHRGFCLPIFSTMQTAPCFYYAHFARMRTERDHRRGQCVPYPQPDVDGELRHQTEVLPTERSFHHETRRRKEQDPRHYRGAAELAHAGERQRYHPGEISIHTLLAESDTLGATKADAAFLSTPSHRE